ncbi:uncharacterized protein LOC126367506 isoform X2 [Pectinophora gossypiella]|nr:uncharacterized protein LOC126367506 isoform X2 [Pectinophora gossypiella]XP_049867007.1 uncharacterized protein LOC126367506 isoform X2 [Pectinophora gossypiella]
MPCLWDNRQVEYCIREAKDQAYESLLEKYRQIHEGASLADLKTKIEHMRAAYRREHKKVLLSRLKGDVEEHTPTLWYYDLLTFLNDVSRFSKIQLTPRAPDEEQITFSEERKPKKRQRKRKYPAIQTVYFSETNDSVTSDDHDDNTEDNEVHIMKQENDHSSLSDLPDSAVTECESFGTTVGLQLKDLDRMQRAIAEKLISEIIFDGRLNRLTVNSKVMHS